MGKKKCGKCVVFGDFEERICYIKEVSGTARINETVMLAC
jgi:hypothetical protein